MIQLLLLLTLVATAVTDQSRHVPRGVQALSQEMIDFINNLNTTWKAGHNFSPDFKDVRVLASAWREDLSSRVEQVQHANDIDIPPFFDARQQWPDCKMIDEIRDQSNCGSCWALAVASVISDRTCITLGADTFNEDLSAEEIVSCCSKTCGYGCHGGFVSGAFEYWIKQGVVTGGLFNGTGCQPYTIPPHHYDKEPYRATPSCSRECVDPGLSYEKDRWYGQKYYFLMHVENIQREILKNGPVVAGFTLYDDFPSYKSGVYQKHSDNEIGSHAVKILGWGVENGVDYWLCANEWNTDWGDKGFFKIKRGTPFGGECFIEDSVTAGLPDTTRVPRRR